MASATAKAPFRPATRNPQTSPTTRTRDLRRDARPQPKLATRPAIRPQLAPATQSARDPSLCLEANWQSAKSKKGAPDSRGAGARRAIFGRPYIVDRRWWLLGICRIVAG